MLPLTNKKYGKQPTNLQRWLQYKFEPKNHLLKNQELVSLPASLDHNVLKGSRQPRFLFNWYYHPQSNKINRHSHFQKIGFVRVHLKFKQLRGWYYGCPTTKMLPLILVDIVWLIVMQSRLIHVHYKK